MKKPLLGVLLALMILSLTSVSAGTTTYEPGCKKGDWVKYDVVGNTTDLDAQNIDWGKLEVLDVVNTNVTVKLITHYKNGTEDSEVDVIDVKNGEVNGTPVFSVAQMVVVAKNLDVNDSLWEGSVYKVNRTEKFTIKDVSRDVIVYQMNVSFLGFYTNTTMKWDKETGLVVYIHIIVKILGSVQYIELTAIDSSFIHKGGVSGTMTLVIGSIIAIVVIVAIVYFLFKRR